jgi:hypothetical protein
MSSSSTSETSESLSTGGNIYVEGIDLVPDCSGEYYINGSGGGKDMYQSSDNKFIICWKDTMGRWELIEFATAKYWFRSDENIFGEFSPHGDRQGNPLVRGK